MPRLFPRRALFQSAVALFSGTMLSAFAKHSHAAQFYISSDSLATFVDKIEWDVAKRGPLLIVAPKQLSPTPRFVGSQTPLPSPPQPNAGGMFPVIAVAEYCGARVASADSLAAIVPTNMTVLNWRNLPPPDLSYGITPDKLPGILLTSLSAEQWNALSQGGIGASQLTDEQRNIWSQIFSPDARVGALKQNDLQKSRLRLIRSLRYTLIAEGNPNSTASGNETPESTPEKPVHTLYYASNQNPPVDSVLFGTTLLQRLPNRSKPGDLSYDVAGLSRRVSLSGMTTVGGVIKAVQAATGIRLSADIRYTELPVIVRGDTETVRAGDLLKLVALSVTGTFRKLTLSDGSTLYHLTDDLTGLGTRHTAIRNWIAQATTVLQLRGTTISEGLFASKAAERAGWYSDKGYTPSPLLQEQIEKQNGEEKLLIAAKELPEAVQTKVIEIWKQYEDRRLNPPNTPEPSRFQTPRYRKDVVQINSTLKLVIETPDGGTIFLSDSVLGGNADSRERERTQQRVTEYWQNPKQALPIRISSAVALMRGLEVSPTSTSDASEWARVAERGGMNKLVLTARCDTPPTAIAEQVRAAKAAAPSVGVHVRFHALRVAPTKDMPAPGVDRNLLGETLTERARRHIRQIEFVVGKKSDFSRYLITDILEDVERARKTARHGDFLSPSLPSVATRVTQALQNIKKECGAGLEGFILVDLEPPGYEATPISYSGDMDTGDDSLGYLPALRATFCEQYGVDPIDLSPGGDSSIHIGSSPLSLPYFPDYGGSGSYTISQAGDSRTLGAKDRPVKWQAERRKAADTLRKTLSDSLSESGMGTDPLIEVLFPQGTGYVPALERQAAEKEVAAHPEKLFEAIFNRKWGRSLHRFRYGDYGENKRDGSRASQRWARQFASLLPQYVTGAKTDAKPGTGFVLDFTEIKTPGEGADLLKDFVITS